MKILDKLNPTNTLSVNRLLAHKLGLNAAVVYASLVAKQAYYAARKMLDEDGYFYSTEDDLKESTSLSKRQQARAVKALEGAGLIEKDTRGMPAKRCFRVKDDVELLQKILGQECENAPTSCPENAQQVGAFCADKLAQNEPHTYKTKENKSKVSINQSADRTDGIDNKRENFFGDYPREHRLRLLC